MNRIKGLVLALFATYWVAVIVIWIAARPVFDQLGGLPRGRVDLEAAEVLTLTALLMLLSVGIVRGWRWLFWLILLAFLAGILRVPAAALELAGKIPQQGPAWYVVLTAIVGTIQFVVALAMAAAYRRSGFVWGGATTYLAQPRR
jgi:asparagine N-glycosylation enzyme membrane subunit Stt3